MPLVASIDSPFGELQTALHLRAYREAVDAHSPFFSPETMRFFGTRSASLSLVERVVVVGCDSNAPEGFLKYWARVFTPEGDCKVVARRDSRKEILKAAERVAFLIRLWNRNVELDHPATATAVERTLNKWVNDPTSHF